MHEPVSLTSLFDAAEQAALGGDYAAAARLLEDAAREQEATLGPHHRDLANTLNNLAVAHERSGDLDAAEREYRRAHAIAVRAFPSDDPLVVTSAQNLRDFCLVNGRSVDGVTPPSQEHVFDWPPAESGRHSTTVERYELPATPADVVVVTHRAETAVADAPTVVAAAATSAAAAAAPARPAAPAASTPAPPPATPREPPRPTAAPASAPASARPTPARTPAPLAPPARVDAPVPARIPRWAVGFAVVALAGFLWLLFGRPAEAPRPAPPEPVMHPVPPTAGPATAPAPAPTPAPAVPATPPAPSRSPQPAPAAADAGGVTIGEARLCASLVNYRCAAAASPVRAGQLTFYTRLVAARDTAVVHRWYRGDELRQAVRLGVPARAQGFRTYSRGTVYATGGDWRVELRTLDGRILHTETFTVR